MDEIGSMEDVDAMEYAANSGVKLLATVHGASMDEIKRKPGIERLIKHRFFERYVLLGDGIGNVKAIFDDRGSCGTFGRTGRGRDVKVDRLYISYDRMCRRRNGDGCGA